MIFTVLPVILYGCETWSLTLRGQRMFENRMLRRIFGPKSSLLGPSDRRLVKTA
jgi:hypothetical protein